MAADTQFAVFHGAAPGVPTDVTNQTIRFKRADDDGIDASSPVPVPSSGFNYSWRKNCKLRVDDLGSGPDNVISNLRFYSEGQSFGTDKALLVAVAAAYTQASAADESAAIAGAVDVDSYTSAAPLVVNGGTVFSAAEVGDGSQNFVVLQARLGPAAGGGNVAEAKGLVYRYDEA